MADCCRAHWRHMANTIELVHIGTTWQIRLNCHLCFLRPTRVHNPNGKSISLAIFAQLMAEWHRAHWHHLANTIEFALLSAHLSPQPKRQIDEFSHFCTAHMRKSLYFTMGAPFSQNCLFKRGIWIPSNTIPWDHPNPQPKRNLNRFSQFCSAHYCDRPTDRPTDHATWSVTIVRTDTHSTAMQPNNKHISIL